jgi:hypothetical protein
MILYHNCSLMKGTSKKFFSVFFMFCIRKAYEKHNSFVRTPILSGHNVRIYLSMFILMLIHEYMYTYIIFLHPIPHKCTKNNQTSNIFRNS